MSEEKCDHKGFMDIDDDIRISGGQIKFQVYCGKCGAEPKDNWQYYTPFGEEFEWDE